MNKSTDATLEDESNPSRADSDSRRLSGNVRLLGWASLLNDIASEAVFPLLPMFVGQLGGGKAALGLIEGLADSTASLLKLWTGAWSDRIGRRKPFVVAGYALAGLSRPLLAFSTLVWHVVAVRMADRIGKGLRTAPRDALIAETTPSNMHGYAFGYHRAMDHLGAAIGPILASSFLWAFPNQLRWLMFLCIVPGVMVLLLQIFGLREGTARKSSSTDQPKISPDNHQFTDQDASLTDNSSRSSSKLSMSSEFRVYLIALLLFTFANSSDAFLLVRASEAGVATYLLPLLWSAFHILKSVGNRFCGRLADFRSPIAFITFGWILYAIVYLLFGFANSVWQICVLFVGYALFYSLTEPAEKKLVAQFSKQRQAGVAFGWFHTTLGLANLPSSLLFGWIYQNYGSAIAFGYGAIMAMLALVVLMFVKVPESTYPPSVKST